MKTKLDYTNKLNEMDNELMILQTKSETAFSELKNHIVNTPLTPSQLAKIGKLLDKMKFENEQLIENNKLIMEGIKNR